MQILKFGGTSMSDDETWQQVLDIIKRYDSPFVVVSATARTTRELLSAADAALTDIDEANSIADQISDRHKELITDFTASYSGERSANTVKSDCLQWIDEQINQLKNHLANIQESQELTGQTKDAVASIGERLSSYLFAKCCSLASLKTQWVDATEIIRTDSDFGQANPVVATINEQTQRLWDVLEPNTIPIIGGYYGSDEQGNITTLGFEGSDYSASLIGAALDAETIEIWTDVSGIYTCDPRLVKDAEPISQLSFQEATELAYFGAKVLHPSTTKPAAQKEIPVWVKNIFDPEQPGTKISAESKSTGRVKAITYKEHCTIITVTSSQTVMGYEFLADVFDTLRWHHLPVDVVTTTEASVSIGIENGERLDKAIEQLESYGSVSLNKQQGIISLVGCQEEPDNKLLRDTLGQLSNMPANLISFSHSKGNLNIVVDEQNLYRSVKKIHRRLFES